MRKLVLLALLSTTAALSFVGSRPKTTLLFSVKDHVTSSAAVSADGRRVYYWQDTTQLYVFDRAAGRSSRVLENVVGAGMSLAVSPAGDRLAFTRNAEGGAERHLWTVSLDATTGRPNAAPRRATILVANSATFSPDGKSIAFATPTSRTATNLMVIPANGGPERVVAETQGDVWPIAWTKNDSIYFGLSFRDKESGPKNGVYRVSVSNGKPQFVFRTAAYGAYPGLSPDSRFIVAYDSTWDSIVVATASGKRLHTYFDEHNEPSADVWSAGGKAVGSIGRTTHAMQVVDLTGEPERTISDSAGFQTPVWSPDGRRVAAIRWDPNPAVIVVSDVAGRTRRSIPVARVEGPRSIWALQPMNWSPDGRFIVYSAGRGGLTLVDPGSSIVRPLAAKSSLGPQTRWRSDSRAIIYLLLNPPENAQPRKIDIHEVMLDGRDRVLHSIETGCNGGLFCGKIIDDSLASTWIDGEYRVTNFRTRGAPRLVYKREGATAQQPVPTFSSNGRWMAVRRQSASDQSWSIDVMRPDGSAHRSVPLSFRVTSGGNNPWIRDDGAELIVASADCAESTRDRCSGGATFYRVEVLTGKATAIASLPPTTRQQEITISNDGRSLVYLRDIGKRADFYDVDFTELFRVARP